MMAMSALSYLVMWTASVACLPLERDVVFNGQHIDTYIAQATTDKNEGRRRQLRFQLLRMAAMLATFEPARRNNQRYVDFAASMVPYPSAEIARLRNQTTTRTTAQRRHNWRVVLALAAGCGLTSGEIIQLKVEDIELHDGYVRVHTHGYRARTIICLAEWESDLRELLRSPLVSSHLFVVKKDETSSDLGDHPRERRKSANPYIMHVLRLAADDGIGFSAKKLRAAWIVTHLNNHTDLRELLAAIGDKGMHAINRLSQYVTPPTETELIAMFRDARQL